MNDYAGSSEAVKMIVCIYIHFNPMILFVEGRDFTTQDYHVVFQVLLFSLSFLHLSLLSQLKFKER